MLPFPSAALCVLIFFPPLELFTTCVNESLDVAKPIHPNPIVQTSSSKDRAPELPGTVKHLLGRTPCKGLIGGRA